ncbi:chorion peroxidase-like isoform X1 [Wyeomyia smithii]|uniref:chorion peroxidase-like isoform X1 n=2 Tax=Wyeomyia smithii TaxID=174621 RepID=UPI002467C83F|nr:chorion peroxidase-like isoform X1 [Wyeomyia smithii]
MFNKLLLVSLYTALGYIPCQCVPSDKVLSQLVFHDLPPNEYEDIVSSESSLSFSDCGKNEECVVAGRCLIEANGKVNSRQCLTAFRTAGVCCLLNENRLRQVSVKRSIHRKDFGNVFLNAVHDGRQMYAEKTGGSKVPGKIASEQQKPYSSFHQLLQPGQHASHEERDQHDIYKSVFISKQFAEMTNMSLADRQLDRFEAMPKLHKKRCIPAVECNPRSRYRSIDGTCNNLHPERTSWGAAGQPFKKVLPPAYEDGVWAPRTHSVNGNKLASPRTISATIIQDVDRPEPHLNLLLAEFGQFLVHDFVKSASIKIGNKEIECCTTDGSQTLPGDELHFACMPIDVSPHDPFYSKFGVRCLNFVRLALASEGNCRMGYAKQVNTVTHFIDASQVYGSDDELAASLRTFHKGQLRNSFPVGIEMLPFSQNPGICEPWAKVCFEAGEDRANEIISLVHVHTLFLREHNRIANILSQVNSHWNDEILYQETRKIVIAEFQHIVYNEYLPIIIGVRKARQYGLLDEVHGHSELYNDKLKPAALTEVGGAAFRFGHSTIDGNLHIQHRNTRAEDIPIHTAFNDPSRLLNPTSFDDYMFSLGNQAQQQLDEFVTTGLAGLLFAGRAPIGSDLPSLNIQRGRDYALRPYNEYRVWAGLSKIKSFQEMGPIGNEFAKVYESPDDIDLWIGGLLEVALPDGLLGETFAHLIAEQFARLKYSDRYYYTNSPDIKPDAFTSHQLRQFQRITLASVICANLDKRRDFYQAPHAFLKSGSHNLPVPCNQYHNLDFEAWRN